MTDQKAKQKNTPEDKPLIILGANYRSSTMLMRDRLYIAETTLPSFYKRLLNLKIDEAIILSSTDLTEFIISVSASKAQTVSEEIVKLLSAHAGESRSEIESQIYRLSGREAVKHLFATAAGLDSLVIGDTRLLDQLRNAHRVARANGLTTDHSDNLIETAQGVAERVRRETDIDQRPVSIAAATVQVARDLHGDLAKCSGLLVGAGEMGEMLASSLRSAGLGNLVVTHPSEQRAETLGQHLNCHVGDMESLEQLLTQADLVLTSMNTRRFILDANNMKTATKARKRKPIFVVDTGVPGDVDPSVETIEDAFLYTLDDLERVTREGRASRAAEADAAWNIVDEEAGNIQMGESVIKDTADKLSETNDLENIRQEALLEADGDAEKATQLLLERLRKKPSNSGNT